MITVMTNARTHADPMSENPPEQKKLQIQHAKKGYDKFARDNSMAMM
jgi:hypothetical protein